MACPGSTDVRNDYLQMFIHESLAMKSGAPKEAAGLPSVGIRIVVERSATVEWAVDGRATALKPVVAGGEEGSALCRCPAYGYFIQSSVRQGQWGRNYDCKHALCLSNGFWGQGVQSPNNAISQGINRIIQDRKDMRKTWCWYFARRPDGGANSILAVVETVLATSISLLAVYKLDAWSYFFFLSATAPLLLLRTPESIALGTRVFNWVILGLRGEMPATLPERVGTSTRPNTINYSYASMRMGGMPLDDAGGDELFSQFVFGILHFLYYVFLLGFSILTRVFSTLACAVAHPIRTIRAIPENWWDACFVIDSTKGLEIVPGVPFLPHAPWVASEYTKIDNHINIFNIAIFFKYTGGALLLLLFSFIGLGIVSLFPGHDFLLSFPCCGFFFLFLILPFVATEMTILACYIVSYFYRLSLKSTALVWLPLLYIATDAPFKGWSVEQKLDWIRKSEAGRFARGYALLSGGLLGAKLAAFYLAFKAFLDLVNSSPWLRSLTPIIIPLDVPLWQVFGLINAILAWVTYLYVDNERLRREHNNGLPDPVVEKILSGAAIVKWLITAYTVSCTVYIVYEIARRSHRPPLRLIPIPWS